LAGGLLVPIGADRHGAAGHLGEEDAAARGALLSNLPRLLAPPCAACSPARPRPRATPLPRPSRRLLGLRAAALAFAPLSDPVPAWCRPVWTVPGGCAASATT
jgi:hypothetical protein